MAFQAKCTRCEIRYLWEREYSLRNAACPNCGRALLRTSYRSKWPLSSRAPDIQEGLAMDKWTPDRVRALRRAKGYTQWKLAIELGVHLNTVQNWERGAKAPGGLAQRALLNLEQEAQEAKS